MGLGLEPAHPDQMNVPPRRRDQGLFRASNLCDIFFYGFLVGILSLLNYIVAVFGYGNGDLGHDCNKSYNESCDLVFRSRAAVFTAATAILLLHSFTVRNLHGPVWAPAIFTGERRWYLWFVPKCFTDRQNWYLYYAFAFAMGFLIITIYVPV